MVLITLMAMAQELPEAVGAVQADGGASLWRMMLEADPMVKAIMAALLSMSVACWGIIVMKARLLRKAEKQSDRFMDMFADDRSFDELTEEGRKLEESHLAHVFRTGLTELDRVKRMLEDKGLSMDRDTPGILIENVDRAIQGGAVALRKRLERLLPVLATTGSTAPFIGLFGTVWGIMISFHDIGLQGSANLAVVAPGISEALVATAMGLAAAIPAVVAYNHFSNRIRMIEDDMAHFTADFLNTLKADLVCQVRASEVVQKHLSVARVGEAVNR